MAHFLKSFFIAEDGAVTVDWVVLTAAIVGLAITVATVLADGAVGVSGGVEAALTGWTF